MVEFNYANGFHARDLNVFYPEVHVRGLRVSSGVQSAQSLSGAASNAIDVANTKSITWATTRTTTAQQHGR